MQFRNYKKLWKETGLLEYMAENISEKNREEAAILMPEKEILEILAESAEKADFGFAIFDDAGMPYGLGAIFDDGNIFFVVREDLDMTTNISALKQARKWLRTRLEKYPEIWGYCWEQSTESMRWMRWLGFDFAPPDSPANMTVEGHKFIYFRIRRSKK